MLRRKDIGEADRVLTLFTPGRGKIRAIAKGIRKPRSRKAGHLELFTRAKLLLATGRDLDHVTQAEMVEAYRPLREDLLRSAYAAYMVELLDRFTPDEEENEALYDLLSKGLAWSSGAGEGAAGGEAGALSLAARYFELHLLSMAGYQPQLQRCLVCGQTLKPEDQFFSPGEGGVIDPRCAAAAAKAPPGSTPQRVGLTPVSLNALKVLRFIQANPYGKVAALNVSARTQGEVEYLLARYITILLERQLKSVEFLKLIRREEAQVAT